MKIAGCLYLKLPEVNFRTFICDSSNGGSLTQQFPEFLTISFYGHFLWLTIRFVERVNQACDVTTQSVN